MSKNRGGIVKPAPPAPSTTSAGTHLERGYAPAGSVDQIGNVQFNPTTSGVVVTPASPPPAPKK